jgi:hypothetical protein
MYPGRRVVKLKCGLIAIDCHGMGSAIDRDGDHLARVARIGEGKLGLQFATSLAAHLERNQVSAWNTTTPSGLLVKEGILLRGAADGHAPVIP